MLATLLAIAGVAAAPADPPAAPAAAVTIAADGKPLKALAAWLKHYRKGKIDIYSRKILNRVPLVIDWNPHEITAKESFAVKHGLAPKSGLVNSTWLGDLEIIVEAVAKEDNAGAAEALLELAAVGFGDDEYVREQAPDVVRGVGQKWITKLSGAEARGLIVSAATGALKMKRDLAMPMQGAALRCLGAFADPQYRSSIEPQLANTEPVLRFHAAEALAGLGDEKAALALIAALESESSEVVLPAIVEALRTLYASYLPGLDSSADDSGEADEGGKQTGQKADARPSKLPDSVRLAGRAALGAIGRSSWRADMALLRFLNDFRTKDAIPVLIDLMARFRDNPDQVQSGKLSTLVLHRTHELLVSMTGAVFPADQPDKWRDLWEREKDKIAVQEHHAPEGQAHTVASGFAGIPVQGSRVLFILDLSRSMTFAMTRRRGTQAGKRKDEPEPATRIDFARRELNAAIDGLAENQSFNLITFDGDDEARQWSKAMVSATERNREKFKKHVAKMDPDGGTNLWSGLEKGLKMKSLVYGDRYETNVDEIFILSDGAPSVGEVLSPVEILRLVKECNRFSKMRINTVFISSANEEERRRKPEWMTIPPEELMQRLADENGGKCVILKN